MKDYGKEERIRPVSNLENRGEVSRPAIGIRPTGHLFVFHWDARLSGSDYYVHDMTCQLNDNQIHYRVVCIAQGFLEP